MKKRGFLATVFLCMCICSLFHVHSVQAAEPADDYGIVYIPQEEIVETEFVKVMQNTGVSIQNAGDTDATSVFLNDCSTNYAFSLLDDKSNASNMKKLYVEIKAALEGAYSNTETDFELMSFSDKQLYCIGKIPYSTKGLSSEDAYDVYMHVLADHPLMYFAKEMLVQDGMYLYIIADEEFYQADVRNQYNDKMKESIQSFDELTVNAVSNYEIVQVVHEAVTGEVTYAYEEGTTTPKNNAFVHSIAGYISESKEVVCDGYTETLAAILNYLDIETICGFGWGVKDGEPTSEETYHAWNVVKLGNGNYYSVDATWNDANDAGANQYFCVGSSFYDTHSITLNGDGDGFFIYELPALATDDFAGEDTLLTCADPIYDAVADIEMTGQYQGFSYEMKQNGTLGIIGYTGTDSVVEVPSQIEGHKVVSITDCFNYNDTITEITLPDTICFIGFVGYSCSKLEKLTINSFNPEDVQSFTYDFQNGMFAYCPKLKTIIVNENNIVKTLWTEDNVLYYGDGDNRMLVLYPAGKTDESYSFQHSMKIGSSAFEGNQYIKNVVFEKEIKDTIQSDGITVNPASHVFYQCSKLESVVLKKGALTVMTDWFNGCTSLKSFEIPDTVTKIGSMMFNGCSSLKEIMIPKSVRYIENSAFQDCISLSGCVVYSDDVVYEDVIIDGQPFNGIWNGSNKVVLYCNSGSNTEKYAKLFGISYASIESYGADASTDSGESTDIDASTDSNESVETEHIYKNIVKKATLKKNGKITPVCSICGAKKKSTIIYAPKTIKLSKTTYTYDGKTKKPTVVIKDSRGNKISKSYYKVSYQSGRKKVGKYKVKITFKGKYSGTKTLYFSIKPKSTTLLKVKSGKKQISLKWKKCSSQTTGYEIQYSTNKNFKNAKKIIIKKAGTTSKTIKKLRAKKKYYVRIRTYKTVKVNGKTTKMYSAWSKTKKVTTK